MKLAGKTIVTKEKYNLVEKALKDNYMCLDVHEGGADSRLNKLLKNDIPEMTMYIAWATILKGNGGEQLDDNLYKNKPIGCSIIIERDDTVYIMYMDTKRDDNIKEVLKSAENSLVYETNRDEVKKQLIDEIQREYSDKEIIDASCVKNFENYRKGNGVLNLLYDACKNVDTIEKEDEEVELD